MVVIEGGDRMETARQLVVLTITVTLSLFSFVASPPANAAFRVNTYTDDEQNFSRVAMDGSGNLTQTVRRVYGKSFVHPPLLILSAPCDDRSRGSTVC